MKLYMVSEIIRDQNKKIDKIVVQHYFWDRRQAEECAKLYAESEITTFFEEKNLPMDHWIDAKKYPPLEGEFIATLRTRYPSSVWIGYYREEHYKNSDTATFDYYTRLPKAPKEWEEAYGEE